MQFEEYGALMGMNSNGWTLVDGKGHTNGTTMDIRQNEDKHQIKLRQTLDGTTIKWNETDNNYAIE
jgi:hypothetical protein